MTLRYGYRDDQRLVADTAQTLFADFFSSSSVREFMREPRFAATWRTALGDSGLLGLCAASEIGGGQLGALDALAPLVETGRSLAPWPVADSMVAASCLAATHPDCARAVIAASHVIVIAKDADLNATRERNAWALTGEIAALPWGLLADQALVELDLDGERRLALIDLHERGIVRQPCQGIDPCCPLARVVLSNVALTVRDVLPPASAAMRRLRQLLACAELLGCAQACLDRAVEYMKIRRQFGKVIGEFQALKHIAANDALYLDSMKLALEYAAWAHDTAADDAVPALYTAMHYGAEHARQIAEDAIQCHGGIGFTWDHDLHLYLRRILRLGASLGASHERREAIATRVIADLTAT